MDDYIRFEYEGEPYTLRYTRDSVRTIEQGGFVLSELFKRPMTMLPLLFQGAFLAEHRHLSKKKIDDIFEKFSDKDELLKTLVAMYENTLGSLFDEPKGNEGNISWTANM